MALQPEAGREMRVVKNGIIVKVKTGDKGSAKGGQRGGGKKKASAHRTLRAYGKRPRNAAERAARVEEILRRLDRMYPGATCALVHRSPWELLVATILSAQCTDKRVNMVTPGLFAKYPTPADFAAVRPEVLAQDIRSTGFFNNKAKSIVGAARRVVGEFGGEVPQTMEEMLHHSRRRAQDRQRGAGHGLRHRLRRGGGYARGPHRACGST